MIALVAILSVRMRKWCHVHRQEVDRPYAHSAAGRMDGCDFDWLPLDLPETLLGDSTMVGFVPSWKLHHAINISTVHRVRLDLSGVG